MEKNNYELTVSKTVNASVETVFEAWSKKEILAKWFKPSPIWTIPLVEVDFEIDGKYRVDMQDQDGNSYTHSGRFTEIERPNKISFTWESDFSGGETYVELNFTEVNGKTEIVLRHFGFKTQEACDNHKEGWPELLIELEKTLGA